ncbi:GPI inositol deacylase [Coemansia guatemalensis]|uniref:GPI inositol-deacylase n=1 Tax=Coemansia guatemalensis TaxID=2761395 RepID=A0A9W8HY90_9FUNG|nr:GPI inositol deacylase [Coemansia guatemalensis]
MSVEKINGSDGSLERVILQGQGKSSVEIYLYGATVTSWKSQGQERLFLSSQAKLDGSKAIRGGIPLVFPQFGPGELPQHGFARTRKWEFLDAFEHGESMVAQFQLTENEETLASKWPYKFMLHYTVDLTATTLSTIIKYENTDTREFSFTSLMHNYFRVPNISSTLVTGLAGSIYANKVTGADNVSEDRENITVAENEDRVYTNVPGTVSIKYGNQQVTVRRFNFEDVVLWNPWAEKAAEMSDFGDSEYKNMICVEPGTVSNRIALRPGQVVSCGQLLTDDEFDDIAAANSEDSRHLLPSDAEDARTTDKPAGARHPRTTSLGLLRGFAGTIVLLMVSALLGLLAAHSYFHGQTDAPNCAMSYSRPQYIEQTEFGRSWTRYSTKYTLFLYREGLVNTQDEAFRIPVLFIPGNAGSHKQVRSIASSTASAFADMVKADPAAIKHGKIGYDFFTISLNEELTALHGYSILEQADFVNDAIRYILSLYPKTRRQNKQELGAGLVDPESVVVVGHSMGGVVARTVFTLPNYVTGSIQALFTLSTPHNNPTASLESHVEDVYSSINQFWRHGFHNGTLSTVSLVSIAGGNLDSMINSDYTYVGDLAPPRNSLSILSSGINDVWLSLDHQSILWCAQMARKFATMMVQIMDARQQSQLVPLDQRMGIMRNLLYSSIEDDFATRTPSEPRKTNTDDYRLVSLSRSNGIDLDPSSMRASLAGTGSRSKKQKVLHLVALDGENASSGSSGNERIVQILYDPMLFTTVHGGNSAAQLTEPAFLGCKRSSGDAIRSVGADGDTGIEIDVNCEAVPMATATKLPLKRDGDDPTKPVPTLHYVEVPVADMLQYDYVGLEVPVHFSSRGFLHAAIVDRPHQQTQKPGYLRSTKIKATASSQALGLRTRIRLDVPESPFFVFRAKLALQRNKKAVDTSATKFQPIIRQSDGRQFESKFWYDQQTVPLAIHGRGAYMPSDDIANAGTLSQAAAWNGLYIDIWADADHFTDLEVALSIDWYSSLNRTVKRYDMALLALSFVWVCLVIQHQLRTWNSRAAIFPSSLAAIESLIRNGTLAVVLGLGIMTPILQELIAHALQQAWSPATQAAWSNLFMGVRGSGWTLGLVPAVLLVVSLGFVALQALALTMICGLAAWLFATVARWKDGKAIDQETGKANAQYAAGPAVLATLGFVAFVSTAVPYQFAFVIIYLAQLITAARTMALAQIAGDTGMRQLGNYQLGLLLFWTNSLPYCVPELLVWVRNISVLWFEDAPAGHNLVNMAGFFALRMASAHRIVPRLTSSGLLSSRSSWWLHTATYALLGAVVAYAWLFSIRRPYILYSIANAVSAWIAAIQLVELALRLCSALIKPSGRQCPEADIPMAEMDSADTLLHRKQN